MGTVYRCTESIHSNRLIHRGTLSRHTWHLSHAGFSVTPNIYQGKSYGNIILSVENTLVNNVGTSKNILWRVRLFDGPILEDASGNQVRHFRSQRIGALLAYLALNLGSPCPREELYEALWPDEDIRVTSNRLRVSLSSLRRQMEPFGVRFGSVIDVSDPGRVRLREETVWCDAAAFERALKAGRNEDAARLARGTLLPGYYDEWIVDARLRLETLGADLDWEAVTERAPVEESESPAVSPSPHHRLPLYLTRFFGREAERQHLLDRVLENRLVTITGPGGIGKTRLAVEMAADMPLSTVFVPLADLPGTGNVPGAILQALVGTPQPDTDSAQLVDLLERRGPSLLILDNAEHLVNTVSSLSLSLLEAVPDLHLLITSRQRLDISGEETLSLEPLDPPRHFSEPDRLMEFPAIALFLDRARIARPDFTLTSRHITSLVEICCRLEGMPLALELAAARVTSQTPAQIATALAKNLMDLASHQRGLSARHRSLRAAIQGSFDLLPPKLQTFFSRLAVFQGGWTAEAARAVTGCIEAEAFLEELGIRSLVVIREEEESSTMRYSFLETLRQFAAEKMPLSPIKQTEFVGKDGEGLVRTERPESDPPETARRHADYFLHLAERSAPLVDAQGASAVVAELEREHENLRAALQWIFDNDTQDVAYRFVNALSGFWVIRGHLSDGRRWYNSLLSASDEAPTLRRADILFWCGVFAVRQNELCKAKQYVEKSLALYRQEDNTIGIRKCILSLADACRLGGEHTAAIEKYRACLDLCKIFDNENYLAKCHHGIGISSIYQGEYDAARHHLEIALGLRRKISHPLDVARTQNLLAFAVLELGDLNAAERLHRTGLEVFIEYGERWYQASTLYGLAAIAYVRGELESARAGLENGLAIMRDIGSQESVVSNLAFLAYIYMKLDRGVDATRAAHESLEISLRLENIQSIAMALECSSILLAARDHNESAARLLAAAAAIRERLSIVLSNVLRADHQSILEALERTLGTVGFETATQAGRSLSPEEAAYLALTLL